MPEAGRCTETRRTRRRRRPRGGPRGRRAAAEARGGHRRCRWTRRPRPAPRHRPTPCRRGLRGLRGLRGRRECGDRVPAPVERGPDQLGHAGVQDHLSPLAAYAGVEHAGDQPAGRARPRRDRARSRPSAEGPGRPGPAPRPARRRSRPAPGGRRAPGSPPPKSTVSGVARPGVLLAHAAQQRVRRDSLPAPTPTRRAGASPCARGSRAGAARPATPRTPRARRGRRRSARTCCRPGRPRARARSRAGRRGSGAAAPGRSTSLARPASRRRRWSSARRSSSSVGLHGDPAQWCAGGCLVDGREQVGVGLADTLERRPAGRDPGGPRAGPLTAGDDVGTPPARGEHAR